MLLLHENPSALQPLDAEEESSLSELASSIKDLSMRSHHSRENSDGNMSVDSNIADCQLTMRMANIRIRNTIGGQGFESIVKGAFECSSVIDWYWMGGCKSQAMTFLKAVLLACLVCLLLVVRPPAKCWT